MRGTAVPAARFNRDDVIKAAGDGRLRLPIAEVVSLKDAIPLVIALEQGRKLNGKGLVSMN